MVDRLDLSDSALEAAGESLCGSAHSLSGEQLARSIARVQSFTGLGAELEMYLAGLRYGALALSDAAQTVAREIASIMYESAALDARLAESFAGGFAMPQGRSS